MIALAVALTLQQSVAAFEAGRLGEAQAALAALAPWSAEAETWFAAAKLENDGDARAAQALLESALRRDPQSWRAHLLFGAALARQIGEASIFGKLRLAPRMRAAFERAVELCPSCVEARMALLQFDVHAPRIAGGGDDKAREQAQQIERLSAFRGQLAWAAIDDAPAHFERALQLAASDAERAEAESARGAWLLERNRPAEAAASLRAAAGLAPSNPSLKARLAQALHAAGQEDEAMRALYAALEIDPQLAAANRLLVQLRPQAPADGRTAPSQTR